MTDEENERRVTEFVRSVFNHSKDVWYNDGERHAAMIAAKLINKMAPDCVEPFCLYFAHTRAWGEFIWARFGGEKPDWLNEPVE